MKTKNVANRTLPDLLRLKEQVMSLYRDGVAVMRIVVATGLSYPTVRKTIDACEAGDLAAILPQRRGRRAGEGRLLSSAQEASVRRAVCEALPSSFGLRCELWSRAAVGEFIRSRFGVRLSPRGLDNYLARWGLAVDKGSRRRLCDHCPPETRGWLLADYQQVAQRAKAARAEIYWVVMQPLETGTGTPLQLLAAVSNRGLARWLVLPAGGVSAHVCLLFLSGLTKDAGRRVLLIADPQIDCEQLLIKAWLERHADSLEFVRQPGCRQLPPNCALRYTGRPSAMA